jgi:hypothetical protein
MVIGSFDDTRHFSRCTIHGIRSGSVLLFAALQNFAAVVSKGVKHETTP